MAYKQVIDRIPDEAFIWEGNAPNILTDNLGNRWFLAVDISRALGYSHYEDAVKLHVYPQNMKRFGQIKSIIVSDVPSRTFDNFRFLSEEGLYHFIYTSKRKPYARQLKSDYF